MQVSALCYSLEYLVIDANQPRKLLEICEEMEHSLPAWHFEMIQVFTSRNHFRHVVPPPYWSCSKCLLAALIDYLYRSEVVCIDTESLLALFKFNLISM